jgi:hypothetical protein
MSADKRTVTTDALETLGNVITHNEKRDAIHLAVENTQAPVILYPGQDVDAKGYPQGHSKAGEMVGIVDPFLDKPLAKGQHFWLVIYPRQIHSLRHVWTHPAFPDVAEIAEIKEQAPIPEKASEQWLRDFCENNDCPSYDIMMKRVKKWLDDGEDEEYITFWGIDAHCDIPPEFWLHFQIVTGMSVPDFQQATSFSCSC